MAHAWENEPACPAASSSQHPWEDSSEHVPRPAVQPQDDSASDSDCAGEFAEDPQREFVNFLVLLLLTRTLNAREFCTIMWWASRCGLAAASTYGFRPGAPSGHFQRHCKTVVEPLHSTVCLYEVETPGSSSSKLSRGKVNVPIVPAHEAIDADLRADAGSALKLEEACAGNAVPPAYFTDPVVQARGAGKVWPLGLFIDGVQYSLVDTVIGFWFVCLITGKRWLTAAIRKSTLCDCGCKGWCTMWEVMSAIAWSIAACRAGVWPTRRHDGQGWRASDEGRAAAAGRTMAFPCVVVHIRGDWSEYAGTLGLPTWYDGLRPCY